MIRLLTVRDSAAACRLNRSSSSLGRRIERTTVESDMCCSVTHSDGGYATGLPAALEPVPTISEPPDAKEARASICRFSNPRLSIDLTHCRRQSWPISDELLDARPRNDSSYRRSLAGQIRIRTIRRGDSITDDIRLLPECFRKVDKRWGATHVIVEMLGIETNSCAAVGTRSPVFAGPPQQMVLLRVVTLMGSVEPALKIVGDRLPSIQLANDSDERGKLHDQSLEATQQRSVPGLVTLHRTAGVPPFDSVKPR